MFTSLAAIVSFKLFNAIVIGIEVLTSAILILLVLLHSGKGGGLSDMFGGGGGLSGGTSAEKTLDRLTVGCAVFWAFSTFWLSWKWI
jgi:preprotein translocase subunit SecG